MLAPSEAGREPASEPTPAPVQPKRRTITLTNRAPIQIVEDDWPIIAHGGAGYEHPGGADLYSWSMTLRVRKEVETPSPYFQPSGGRVIIHAKYSFWDDNQEAECQTVRVGRLITRNDSHTDLWKHILAVGEELRERIDNEHLKREVTGTVDRCFAALPAQPW